jgi:hypothetical protein
MTFKSIALRVAMLSVGIAAWAYFRWPGTSYGGMEAPSGSRSFFELAYGMAMTLLGVFLGSFYRRLAELKQQKRTTIGNPKTFVKQVLLSIDLWMGLCGAPIVFGIILRSAEGMDLPGYTMVALENGFCCLVVLSSFTSQDRGRAAGDETAAGA